MVQDSTLIYDLPAITLRGISVSDMSNNVYLLTSKKSGVQVLIDAADEPEKITALLDQSGMDTPCDTRLQAVLTTHQHWDHIRALPHFADIPGIDLVAGDSDASAIEEQKNVTITRRVLQGDKLSYDGIGLDVLHLRGHTPGSVAFVYPVEDGPTHIFTGDSLFPAGVGKTNSPEDFSSLVNDVEARIFSQYDDDTVIHPGHGSPTTVGAERPSLAQWRERGW